MKFVPDSVSRFTSRQVLTTQKHSPQLLFGAGVVGIVGTIVLASRATLKLEDILIETQETLEQVNKMDHDGYSEEDRNKDKILVYLQTGSAVLKLYGPALGLGVVSIAALAGSNRILSRRNASLSAAYAGLDKAMKSYRLRVGEEVGEEREKELFNDVREIEVVGEDGKKKKVKAASGKGGSPYAVVFDQHCDSWSRDPEVNLFKLSAKEKFMNDLLRIKGHLFLNEVYDSLGLPRTTAGAVVGWIYDSELGGGDGFVSFGVMENLESGKAFVNGDSNAVWLDFNVDGEIYKLIERI